MAGGALDRLRRSLEDLAPVLDASHNGIVIVDHRGVVLVYNRAAALMLGDRPGRQVGRHLSQVRPEAWPEFQQILRTGRPHIARRIEFPAATIIANRNPIILDGQVAGVISVFQDQSAYEAIVSELESYKELSRELEAIFESSYDGLYITDGRADTIRVNSAYERITGLKRGDLIGRNMRDLVAEGVFDHSVTLDVLARGRSVTIMQNIRGGKQVMVTGTPIFDDQGRISLVVTNVRDITELNQLRTQLAASRLLTSRYYQTLKEQQHYERALKDMVVKSESMARVLRMAVKVAEVDTVVLIQGESGVGKTMLARVIHQMSPRRNAPFVKISCGAIPESLLESELFGYVKGAFTGAAPEGKAGLIEAGHTGTVFLDEVGELSLGMQVKLLQVIEEQSFTRVGDTRPTRVDVRIIAATHRDLKELVAEGRFRQDLYYRLNVVPLHIPPLRRRREDIPALALHHLARLKQSRGVDKRLEPEVLDALMAYDYPGNVRELINLVERMAVMSEGESIGLGDLPGEFRAAAVSGRDPLEEGLGLKEAVERLEAQMIRAAVERSSSLAAAARRLGIHPTTLWRKMGRLGLRSSLQDGNTIALLQ